jgi:siroheme synthase (precorrin-2 oxidase/ferrochelatase)
MTVERLEREMTWEELFSWLEFYKLEAEQQKRAQKEASDKAKTNRKRR